MQENSYYAFGMVMPNSTVPTPTNANKNLYNGGSEWQNDFGNLPDLMQTFYRNYDAALGRWTGVDPMAESAESMTSYQYGGNNPIMMNDPMGNLLASNGDGTYTIEHGAAEVDDWEQQVLGGGGGGSGGGIGSGGGSGFAASVIIRVFGVHFLQVLV